MAQTPELRAEAIAAAQDGDMAIAKLLFESHIKALFSHDSTPAIKDQLAEAFEMKAQCEMALEQLDSALSDTERAVMYRPSWADGHCTLARVLREHKMLWASWKSYQTALSLLPSRDDDEFTGMMAEALEVHALLQQDIALQTNIDMLEHLQLYDPNHFPAHFDPENPACIEEDFYVDDGHDYTTALTEPCQDASCTSACATACSSTTRTSRTCDHEDPNEAQGTAARVWECSLIFAKWLRAATADDDKNDDDADHDDATPSWALVDTAQWDATNEARLDVSQWSATQQWTDFVRQRGCGRQLKVLELGSGIGLAGAAVVACTDADVTLTDTSAVTKGVLALNVARLKQASDKVLNVQAQALDWGQPLSAELHVPYDIVIATDAIYNQHAIEPYFSTLHSVVGKDPCLVVMVHKRRRHCHEMFMQRCYQELEGVTVEPWPADKRFFIIVGHVRTN